MKTQEFLTLLAKHQDKSLLFEYALNQIVPANYHITEVKHVTIDSVDCGAKTDTWKETVIQAMGKPKRNWKKRNSCLVTRRLESLKR